MARTKRGQSTAKKQKKQDKDVESNSNVHSLYKPGSITRVKLQNFLTYHEVEFFPGPRLNVVCGPNGTGKSTILCAICLGLGGQPTILGRADDARTFIMHEKQIADIEIELAPPEQRRNYSRDMDDDIAAIASAKKHIFRRVIDRTKGAMTGRGYGSSTFFINGEQVNIKAIQKVVSEVYSISIDNLCTFLPQDKVGSFSGFSPKMLLEETCKALSKSHDLYTDLHRLIELEEKLKTETSSVKTKEDELRTLQAENAHLEREKERMEERKEAEELYKKLKQKHSWLSFDEARQRAVDFKEQREGIRNKLKDSQIVFEPIEQKKQNYARKLERIKNQSSKDKTNISKYESSYETSIRTSEEFQDKMEEEHLAFRDLDTKQRQAEKNVSDQKVKLEKFTTDLAEYPNKDEIQLSLQTSLDEGRKKKKECQQLRSHQQMLSEKERTYLDEARNVQVKLSRMQDEKAMRKKRLFQNEKLAATYKWLESNRGLFRRQVWGPIAIEVTVKSPDVAACLEQHVSQNVWKMYVVECQEDYDVLFKELRVNLKLPVNIQIIPRGELQDIQRNYSSSKFLTLKSQHGVAGYLDELFSAPDPILQALRILSQVNTVIVGTQETQNSIDRHGLLETLSQRDDGSGRLQNYCIFTSNHGKYYKYNSIISRYSGMPSMRIDDVNLPRILAPGIPPEQKNLLLEKEEEIKLRIDSLKPQIENSQRDEEQLRTQIQELHQEHKGFQETLGNIRNLAFRIDNAKKKLEEYEAEASKDLFAEKQASRKRLRKFLSNSVDALETAGDYHEKYMKGIGKLAGVKMTEDGYKAKIEELTEELNEKRQALSDLENSLQTISFQFNESKKAMRYLKSEAEKLAPLEDEEGNDLPLKEQLEQLAPSSVQEVNVAMEEAELKINSITDNPELLKQYEQRKKEIEELEEELNNLQDSNNTRKQLEDTAKKWNDRMHNILQGTGGVNDKFVEYMKELDCAGEVKLNKKSSKSSKHSKRNPQSDSEFGFKEWGIEMLVRFRESTQLSVLSAQAHSGGERSVGTIMYLMALQDMMVSPFRCVDEINQGLDDRNERLVFRRIVANATSKPKTEGGTDHSGQYFLITPKLLPNLTDMEQEDVTILCIFNGTFGFNHYNDWTSKILKKRLRDEDEEVDGSDDGF